MGEGERKGVEMSTYPPHPTSKTSTAMMEPAPKKNSTDNGNNSYPVQVGDH